MEANIELNLRPISDDKPLIIAGPCSAETEEQVLETARELAQYGIKYFRAGIWKPRTKPGGFEGVGAKGLPWLAKVKEETGMKVCTEVAKREHVLQALEAGVDRIMLDNFTPEATRDAVKLINGRTEIESSGGITLDTLRAYGEAGVDFISVGALTHSVKGLDMSFKAC